MGLIAKVQDNIADARAIGLGFVSRHLRPFAKRHRFTYAGKPITIRKGSTDGQIVRELLRDGEYDLPPALASRVMARYEAILADAKTPVIIDAGGNIGTTAVWFARTYPAARIVTIEPDPGNFAILSLNVAAWPNVTATRSALGGRPGAVALSGVEEWGFQTTRSPAGDTPVITVADAIALAGENTAPLIVKIDIEGFEADVFDGDCAWIDATDAMFIEPHDWLRTGQATSRSFQREMGKRDFDLFIRRSNLLYVRR